MSIAVEVERQSSAARIAALLDAHGSEVVGVVVDHATAVPNLKTVTLGVTVAYTFAVTNVTMRHG